MEILFWISVIGILYSFLGYPLSLSILSKILKNKKIEKEICYPKVSFIVAAHNEEKAIEKKLKNIISLNYPIENLEVIIASDNSVDLTNSIVNKFIQKNKKYNIKLHIVEKRQGKTNAQNEAVKISTGDILVFSDANSIWDKEGIIYLVRNFKDKTIDYVCGRLKYINFFDNITSKSESSYWNYDLFLRKKESNLSSITAGNGAIYAIRKRGYIDIDPICCHDGTYPMLVVINGKRAVYEEKAIAYEKAGENTQDEFFRKVRMNRNFLKNKYKNIEKYNPFKVGLYSYFYFVHRYLRYSLYLFHILCLITLCFLYKLNILYFILFIGQISFYILALIGFIFKIKSKIFYYPYYYTMTIFAQLIGMIKSLFGLDKPFWEKAESTR